MSRGSKKANCGDHIDRISELPSNVIDVILQHLPIEDAVRTSILSRKWRYMWVSIPWLEFGVDFFENCRHIGDHEIPSIITEVLFIHKGPLSKFTLDIPYVYPIRIKCLYKWILFLSESDIKAIELVNLQTEPYQMPSHLFSCQGLTYLELQNFELSLPPNFGGFKSLVDLHLSEIRFESSALESLISGCPVLEELTISYCSGFDSIKVSAPSLKVLYIEDGRLLKSICYEKANNLTILTLRYIRFMKFVQLTVSDFIKDLRKLRVFVWEMVTSRLEYHSIGITPHTLPKTINSLKYLKLDGVDFSLSRELLSIVCLLKSSPNLVEFNIKSYYSMAATLDPNHLRALDCNSCCLSQLRKVKIKIGTSIGFVHALDFIRFLLAHASSLENLTFKVGGLQRSDTLLSISRDLLQMERASQRAQVQFLYRTS